MKNFQDNRSAVGGLRSVGDLDDAQSEFKKNDTEQRGKVDTRFCVESRTDRD